MMEENLDELLGLFGDGGKPIDVMHEETNKEIQKLEKRLAKEYKQAEKELRKKTKEYFDKFDAQDKQKRAQVNSGKLSKEEYIDWRKNKMLYGETLKQKTDVMAQYMVSTDRQAADIINKSLPNVYAKNYNYSAYQIEKGYKIKTSFTLHDNKSVERLAHKDPKLLPYQHIKGSKAHSWSKRKINSAITQGILQGESIPDIAKRLDKVAEMGWKSAVRNARTAMTGAQNGGRLDSYSDAKRMGIGLKKRWMATLDDRTRKSHQRMDGEVVETEEPFSNDLMFPGDAGGKPAETYNCRCTMIAVLDDHPPQNFERLDNIDGVPIDYVTYDQWAKSKGMKSDSTETFAERIKTIRNDTTLSAEEKIQKAGQIFADEMNKSYGSYNKTYEEYENAMARIDELIDASLKTTGEELEIIIDELDKAISKKGELYKLLYSQDTHSKILADKLREVRPVGYSDEKVLRAHLNNSRSPMRKHVEFAYQHYPTEWIEKSIQRSTLKVKKVNRGYYSDWRGEIAISGWGGDDGCKETAFHELGHRFERAVPDILKSEKEFYAKRTAGEDLRWLGKGYAKSEITRKDDFLNAYMGKDYGGSAYELVSMGFEYAYTNPMKLAEDPDMQRWIYGILCTL